MTDDFDAFLRDRLGAGGDEWAPVQPPDAVRAQLTERIRRRRRAHTTVLLGLLVIVVGVSALVSLTPGGAEGRVTASSVAPGHHAGAAPTTSRAPTPPARRPAPRPGAPAGSGRGAAPRTATSSPAAGPGGTPQRPSGPIRPSTPTGTTPTTRSPVSRGPATTRRPPASEPGSSAPPPSPPAASPTTSPPGTASGPSAPTTSTTAPPQYIYTDADTGQTASVPIGATIELDLSSCPGTTWGPVISTNPRVVAPRSASPDPLVGSARVFLVAAGPGRAVLHASALSTCTVAAAVFRLTVDVQGNPSSEPVAG